MDTETIYDVREDERFCSYEIDINEHFFIVFAYNFVFMP